MQEKKSIEINEKTIPETDEALAIQTKKTKKKLGTKGKRVLCAVASVFVVAGAFLGGMLTGWLSLDDGMRSLIETKNAIDSRYYVHISDAEFYGAVFESVNGLLDDYSAYMTAEEYAETRLNAQGTQTGIGLSFSTQDANGDPQLLVTRVSCNSPAEQTGIVAGEYIVGYGKTEDTIAENNIFKDFFAFVSEREENEKFYLKVYSATRESRVVEIYKAAYTEGYVYYRTSTDAYAFGGENATTLMQKGTALTALDDDTAYIRLIRFNGAAAQEFDAAMGLFRSQSKKHLVLDLRGNGGGYLNILQSIASYFCKNSTEANPVVAVAHYNDGAYKEYYRATGNYYGEFFQSDSKIYVLADRNSASASECLLGCMIEQGALEYENLCLSERNGVAKTYGKGIMQTTYPLSQGDAIKLTTAKICWPVTESSIHGVGILPTEENGVKTVAESYEGDTEIEYALKKFGISNI